MTARTEFVNCNICHNNNYKNICTKFGLNLVKCKHCGLVYANPRLIEEEIFERYESPLFFEEYLTALNATSTSFDLGFIRSHYYFIIGLIDRFFAPGKKLLDVGCGAGFFLKIAGETGWNAEGIEISKVASEYAKNVVNVNVYRSKLEDIKFSTESFDLVTMLDIIEHLTDPLRTLEETYRILKSQGIVIVSTPDVRSLSRMFLGKHWAILSPAEHLYNFSKKTLHAVLSEANFRVLGIRNLLIFNPEYTHDKNQFRYFFWKNLHEKIEKKKFMENLHGFEYLDLMLVDEEIRKKIRNKRFTKRMKRSIYRKAKSWLRGDMLIAIAKKT